MRYLKDYGGRLRRAVSSAALLLILLLYTCGMGSQKFFLPLFTYSADGGKGAAMAVKDGLMSLMPLCCYNQEKVEEPSAEQGGTVEEEEITLHIIEGEGEEGSRMDGEEAGEPVSASGETSEEALQSEAITLEELLAQENSVYRFEAPQKVAEYDWNAMTEYATLISTFYTIDSTAQGGSDLFNLESLMGRDITIDRTGEGPQILIYHTHSQEAFADSIPGDTSTTIIGAGEKLAQLLRDEYGFNVIHHTGVYDVESRDYAYSAAGPAIEQILAENPSIEVVIDLHRDGVADNTRLVSNVGGRPTAQFMFFNGLSYLKGRGDIDYLVNPYVEENLAFSFQMKLAADEYYPGFSRNIYLKGMRYNMHYREKSLLIEVGAQTNTVEEVMNAIDPIAHILAMVLKGEKP